MQRLAFGCLVLLLLVSTKVHANELNYATYKNVLEQAVEHVRNYVNRESLEYAPLEPRDTLGLLQQPPTLFVRTARDHCFLIDQTWRYWGTVAEVIVPEHAYVEVRNLIKVVGDTYWVLVERANCWDRIDRYIVSYRSTPELHHIYVSLDEEGLQEIEVTFVNTEGFRIARLVTVDAKSLNRKQL